MTVVLEPATPGRGRGVAAGAWSAAAVTIPHALGLGLIAYGPVAYALPAGALALWSAALPGALAALVAPRAGIAYAPTTVMALLFAGAGAIVSGSAQELGLGPQHMLAACGLTAALACAFQWLFGRLRLASLARFLPVSVMHGFAAGVGLSMVAVQLRSGFGAGDWTLEAGVPLHAAAALTVLGLALLGLRRWPRWPWVLPVVAMVAAGLWWSGAAVGMVPSAPNLGFALPPVPDYTGAPWWALLHQHGAELLALALLTAIVNSLDVVVFNQELELEHGVRGDPNQALQRESLVGLGCALCGLIPASVSSSRSRIILAQAGPAPGAAPAHAAILVAVAVTGHVWLPWLPMACLSGALLLAGLAQVPPAMWSRRYARTARAAWSQAWLVALVFPVAGGGLSLLAGLGVATLVLLRTSAGSAVRRVHLNGELRSRRLLPAQEEAWLASRMQRVAVVELQGVMSFGVAGSMVEQVRALLGPDHDRVLLDAHRVPDWDTTALAQLRALGRDLARDGRELVLCGLAPGAWDDLRLPRYADLDRALEAAEDAMLAERPEAHAQAPVGALGELGEGLGADAMADLKAAMVALEVADGQTVFAAGDAGRALMIVLAGRITMATAWPPALGLRLATVGPGMVFGEMAFLNGRPRTAYAGCEAGPARLAQLSRAAFDDWAQRHPGGAVVVMSNLALMGTRRLAATTRQLRGVLE